MKRTIEIEVPDGKKAVWRDNKMVFEDVKPKLPMTWEEFYNNYIIEPNEYFIGSDSNVCPWIGTKYRQPTCNNMMPSKEAAEQHHALIQLHQLRDWYRQGWKPDWNDINTYKYCIWSYRVKEYHVSLFLGNIHFLSFQSREIAEEFLNNFHELIEEAGDLI